MPAPVDPPAQMDVGEKARYRHAAFLATRILPGAIGELISREVMVWEMFGYRLDQTGLMNRAVDQLIALGNKRETVHDLHDLV